MKQTQVLWASLGALHFPVDGFGDFFICKNFQNNLNNLNNKMYTNKQLM